MERPIQPDPVDETIAALPTWPDSALFLVARAVGQELSRRRLPTPAALPVVNAAYMALGLDLFSTS